MIESTDDARPRFGPRFGPQFGWLRVTAAIACLWGVLVPSLIAQAPGRIRQPVFNQIPNPLRDDCLGFQARSSAHSSTGLLRFVGTPSGQPIPHPRPAEAAASPESAARSYLQHCGVLFGLSDPTNELQLRSITQVDDQRTSVRFQQHWSAIPVIGGELVVQIDAQGNVISIFGEISPPPTVFGMAPAILPDTAVRNARDVVSKEYGLESAGLNTTAAELWIYDPALIGPGSGSPPVLVWRMNLSAGPLLPIRVLVLVDALHGSVTLHFNQIESVLDRETYTAGNETILPGTLVCDESNPTCTGGDTHAVAAHNHAADTYRFFSATHGRDSIDGAGHKLLSTVRYGSGYANTFWTGSQVVYGDALGFAMADDMVAHEFTHGFTDSTSDLFYYYQSGAISESFSDMWGEFVDLTNGTGNDSTAERWMLGEDLTGLGAIRDMENPPAFGDPDRVTSPLYHPGPADNGGVHHNSGINNKAVSLLVDGGVFNGHTVAALGIDKTAHIYYEVQTNLLTSGADYADLHDALFQACNNLAGTGGITALDCQQVQNASSAVEMDLQPVAGFDIYAPICAPGESSSPVFFDDLELGSGNFATLTPIGTERWTFGSPYGGFAHSGQNFLYGNDFPGEVTDSSVVTLESVAVPAGAYLHFTHAFGFEPPDWDGGVVEYSTDGGATWIDAGSLFDANGYGGVITTMSDNPLAGRAAFVSDSHGYISSRLDLSSLAGHNVRFRWRMGLDQSVFNWGWWLDDVGVYTCDPAKVTPIVPNSGKQGLTPAEVESGITLDSPSVMLSPLSLPDFALIALPSTLPVAVGDDAVFQIDVIPQPGFTGDVALNFATQTSANLLVNPSFEDVTGDLATNWSLAASASTSYSTSIDAAGHSGSAQKITISSPGSWGLYFYQFLNLQLNQTYEWTLWYKTDSLNGIVAEISNSSHTQIVASQSLPGTNGVWQQATISFVYTNSLANMLRIASNAAVGFWLDDFNLQEVNATAEFPGAVFTPSVITGGAGSSVLTIPTVATGSFPFSVVGTSFSLTRLVAMTMEVIDSPDFTLNASPSTLEVLAGEDASFQIDVSPLAGFTGDVTLTLPALPGAFFNPPVIVGGSGSSVLTLPTVVPGSFPLTIEGTSGSLIHPVDITLDVVDFALNASPSTLEVLVGEDAVFQIDVTPLDGFAGDVTLTLPASPGAVFTPSVIVGGTGSSVLSVPADVTGTFPLSVVGTSGSRTHPLDITLDVVDFALTASPPTLEVIVGDDAVFQIDVTPLAAFTGDVTLTLPASPGAVFTPAVIVGGAGSSVLTVPTDTAGTFPLAVFGTSGSLIHPVDITLDVVDFALTVSPSTLEVIIGDAAQFQIDVSPLAGFTGDVTLTLPASPGAVFTPAVIVGGAGSSVLTVPTDTAGTFPLSVVGTSGSLIHPVDITLDVVDFALTVSPSATQVIVGDDAQFQIGVSPLAGFTGDVTLTLAGYPGAVFTPAVIGGGAGSSVLTIPTDTAGTFPLSVSGTSGSLIHPVDITLDVADFALNVSPAAMQVLVGDDAQFQIDVTVLGGFTGDVTLTLPGSPGAVFTPTVIVGGAGSGVLTVPTDTAGTFPLSVSGTSGSLIHPVDITLDVADFALTVSPSTLEVLVGDDAAFQIDVSPLAGFTGDVTLTLPGSPGAVFTPAVIVGGAGSGVLTLPADTAGTFPLAVVGTSGSRIHPVDITLDVVDFALTVSPPTLEVIVGDDAVFQIDVSPLAGFTGDVTLTLPGYPGAVFTPAVIVGGTGSSVLTLPTDTAGTFPLSVVGLSGSRTHPVDITLDVADFSMTVSPPALEVIVGDTAEFQIDVSPLAGFTGDVTLTLAGSPGAVFTPSVIVGGAGSSVLTLPTGATGEVGLSVVGTSGTLIHSIDITLDVVDFALSASPSTLEVIVGDAAVFQIDVTAVGSFTDDVTLTLPGSPDAVFTPAVIVGGAGSSLLTIPTVATGTFPLAVVGTSGSLIHPVDITLDVVDFALTVSPPTLDVFAGDTAVFQIDVSPLAGFTGDVTLTVAGYAGAVFTPPVIIGGAGSSVLTLPTGATGSFPLSVVGMSGSRTQPVGLTLDVVDFALSASPSALAVIVGDDAQFQIDVSPLAGFTGDVTLAVPAFPGAFFTPAVFVGGSGSSILTIPTDSSGLFPLTVVGTSGSRTHTVDITLDVVYFPGFTGIPIQSYAGDEDGEHGHPTAYTVEDGGATLHLTGNAWKTIELVPPYTVTPSTVLEFDFWSDGDPAEINGVGLDTQLATAIPEQTFQIYGTQTWTNSIQDFYGYAGGWQHYVIPVGLYYPAGDFAYLFFADDADAGQNTSVRYRNPQFHEGPGAPIAQDDTFTVIEDSTNNLLAVLANDTDPGDTLTITSVDTTGTQGTAFIHDNGTPADPSDDGINYSTSIGFTGTDSFSYTIEDSGGLSASATVTVTVDPRAFTLTPSSSALAMIVGDDALFQINVTPLVGFTEDVTLSLLGLPGAFFTPSVIVGAVGSSVLTVPTDSSGLFPLTVVGTSESHTYTVDITLDVVYFPGFTGVPIQSYAGNQDGEHGHPTAYTVEDGGATLHLTGNAWKTIELVPPYTVTPSTVLEFDFWSDGEPAEINGVGLDTQLATAIPEQTFQIYGTQTWTNSIQDFYGYAGGWQHYVIPVGLYYPAGDFAYLFFADDADAGQNTSVRYRNPQFHEGPGTPVAQNDIFAVFQDSTDNPLAVLANDTDPGDTLTITSVDTTGIQGTAFIHDNGTPADPSDDVISYTTSIGFTGTDSFSYTIEDSGGLSASATVTVTVDPPDFDLTASPSTLAVIVGDAALFQIDVTPLAGFTGDVTLTLPARPGAVFTPPVIVGGSGSSVLSVPTDGAGLFGLSVVGTSGSLAHLVDITLDVGDFALTVSPSTLAVIVGDDAEFQIDVTTLGGFTDDVTLTLLGSPGAVFTPPVIVGGAGSSVLTVPTDAAGTFPLSVVGTSASLAHPVDITLDVGDFTLNASPPTQAVLVGDDALFQIDVAPVGGFTDDVTLTLPGSPGATFTPPVIVGGAGSSVLTVPTDTAGSFPLSVLGTSGSLTHPIDITLDVVDFALTASPSTLEVLVGDAADFQIDVTALAGFSGDVTLALPDSPGAVFTPPVIVGGSGSSVLTVPTDTAGTFPLSVLGTSGSRTHPVDITLDVVDFALTVSPSSLEVLVGDAADFQIDVTALAGFSGDVSLTLPDAPGAVFTPPVIVGGSGSSVLTVPTDAAGSFPLSVLGTSGSRTHPVDITLDVADFALTASPSALAVIVGDDAEFQIDVSPLFGFTDDVTLTLPASPGAVFTPPVIVGGSGSSVLTVPTVATGEVGLSVVGTSGSLAHPVEITLDVVDFALNASPAMQAVLVGDDALFQIDVTPVGGFTDDVTLTLPASPGAVFTPPVIVGGSGSSVLTIPTLATGTVGLSVVGTSGSLAHPVDITLEVVDFALNASPSTLAVILGDAAEFQIDVSPLFGFTDDVTLTVPAFPGASFTPPVIVGGAGSSVLTVPTLASGAFPFTVVGTTGSLTHPIDITLNVVNPPDFALNASPAAQAVILGDAALFEIDVTAVADFTDDVTLTLPGSPGAVFMPSVIVGGVGSSVLSVPTDATGSFPLSVVGTSGSLTRLADITLDVVNLLSFNGGPVLSYGAGGVRPDTFTVEDAGATLHMTGNTWKAIELVPPYAVTPITVLEFDFWSDGEQAEINGIGLDTQLQTITPPWIFQIYGTQQPFQTSIQDFYGYGGGWQHYVIPVGLYYPAGDFPYLFFVDDADAGQNTSVRYRNPQLREGLGAPVARDDAFSVFRDSTDKLLAVLANDIDPGDTLTITSVDATAALGTALIHDNGTPADPSDDLISYTTSIGFTGTDSFSYTIEDDGGLSGTATVAVTVNPPDFALTASPSTQEVPLGVAADFQIDVTPMGGFTNDVTLTIPDFPGAVFTPPVVAGGSGSSVLTVPTFATGAFGLTVVGTSGPLNRVLDIILEVVDPPDFALDITTSTPEVIVGNNALFQVDVTPIAGFTHDVTLIVPAVPGAFFTPPVIVGGFGSSVLTVPTLATGPFPLSVVGTSGSLTHPVEITVDVIPQPPDFSLTVSPSTLNAMAGDDALFQVDVTPLGGFTGDVTLTVPAFPGAFFTPPVIAGAAGSSVLTLPTVVTGSFSILIHGTYGTPGAEVGTNMVVTFDEHVVKGTGNITIVETGVGTFETIPVSSGQVSVLGRAVTIDPAGTLTNGTDYHVLIDATAIDDTSGNSFAGSELETDWDFTTTTIGAITHPVEVTLEVVDPPDFALDVTPSTQAVTVGDNALFQIDVTPLAGFTGDVTLTIPAFPGAFFTPSVIVGGAGSSVLTVPTDAAGTFPLSVVGTSGPLTHPIDIILDVADFALTVSPSTLEVLVGDAADFQIDVSPLAGFTGDVTLTLPALPGALFNPPVIVGGSGSSVLTIPTVATGSFPLTIEGTSGSLTHPVDITLDVVDFGLNASPSTLEVIIGEDAVFQIDVTPLAGFAGDVTLTLPVLPGPFFNPAVIVGGSGSSILTLPTTASGTFPLSVSGTSGSRTHTVDVTLDVVSPQPDFALNASPSSLEVLVGDDASFQIDVSPLDGFTGDVTLTLPASPGAVFTPAVIVGGAGSSVLTVPTDTAGTFPLAVSGTSGSLIHPLDITLDAVDFAVTASPSTLAVIVGDDAVFQIDVTPLAGFTGDVTLTLPASPGAVFAPAVIVGGAGSSVLTVPTDTAGTFPLAVFGTSGSRTHTVDITLDVVDFALTVSPSATQVLVGDAAQFQIDVSPLASFTGDVTLTLPASPGAVFTPAVIVGGAGSSVLTVPTDTAGTFPLAVFGTSGSRTHTVDITLDVADFALTASPSTLAVIVGDAALFQIDVSPLAGFTGDVTLTLPASPGAVFTPAVIVGGAGSSVLTLPTGATGSFPLTVVGTSGSRVHPVGLTLNVVDFALSASPSALAVIVGDDALFQINVTPLADFTGDVTLAAPAFPGAFFTPSVIVGGAASSVLTVPTDSSGLFPLTVVGTSGSRTHTVDITLDVVYFPGFNGGPVLSYGAGGFRPDTFTVEDAGATLHMTGNTWKAIELVPAYTVTPSTVLEFDFWSDGEQAEINGVGLDTQLATAIPEQTFQIYGTQVWANSIQDFYGYAGGWQHYMIPVGLYYPAGDFAYLFFVDDADAGQNTSVRYRNPQFHEGPGTPVAQNDIFAVFQDSTDNPLAVLANDTDPGDTLTITSVDTTGIQGTAFIHDNGTPADPSDDVISYTTSIGFTGTDSFSYTIEDSGGLSSTATVTVTVNPPDFALTASPSTQEVLVGDAADFQIDVTPMGGFTDDVTLTIPPESIIGVDAPLDRLGVSERRLLTASVFDRFLEGHQVVYLALIDTRLLAVDRALIGAKLTDHRTGDIDAA